MSIMPLDTVAPAKIPTEATISMVRKRAALLPTAEFMKFTASLLTPTDKSHTASKISTATITINRVFIVLDF